MDRVVTAIRVYLPCPTLPLTALVREDIEQEQKLNIIWAERLHAELDLLKVEAKLKDLQLREIREWPLVCRGLRRIQRAKVKFT